MASTGNSTLVGDASSSIVQDTSSTIASVASSVESVVSSTSAQEPTTSATPTTTSPTTTTTAPTSTTPTSTEAVASTTPTSDPTTTSPTTTAISTETASSAEPSTEVFTSVVTESATDASGSATAVVVTVTATSVSNPTSTSGSDSDSGSSTSTSAAALQTSTSGSSSGSGGLSTGGKTAVAVVVPVVVVALLVLAGIFLWRKRKQRKEAEEDRRKEVEEYGFNPNHDPTLPAVGGGFGGSEMAEDSSGYRGWGNTTNPSNRKASTTISGGLTGFSDNGSNQGGYHSPGSPTHGTSATESGDPLMMRRETMDSEGVGVLGGAPVAGNRHSDIHRGPSNASSSYSAANRSDSSENVPAQTDNQPQYYDAGYSYQAYNPHAYDGQPIVQNVGARRNTRIENPVSFPPQGNSGIAQNF